MKIIRAPRPHCGYTQIDNRLLRDHRLSYRARGFLSELLSHPDGWEIDISRMAKRSEAVEGREALRAARRELEHVGYIRMAKAQDPKTGQWSTRTEVYDVPLSGWPEDPPPRAGVDPRHLPDARKPVSGATSGNGVKPQVGPTTGNPPVGQADAGSPGANKKTVTKDCHEEEPLPPPSLRSGAPHDDKTGDDRSPEEDHKPSRPPAPRGTRLPADWQPDAELRRWTVQAGMTREQASAALEDFRDYWCAKTGKGATSLDWSRNWKRWVREELRRERDRETRGDRRRSVSQRSADILAADEARLNGTAPSQMSFFPYVVGETA